MCASVYIYIRVCVCIYIIAAWCCAGRVARRPAKGEPTSTPGTLTHIPPPTHTYIHVCMFSISIYTYISIYLSIYMYLYIYIQYIYKYIYIYPYPYLFPSLSLSLSLSIYIYLARSSWSWLFRLSTASTPGTPPSMAALLRSWRNVAGGTQAPGSSSSSEARGRHTGGRASAGKGVRRGRRPRVSVT